MHCFRINVYKRASLACAARLAETACLQSRPAGAWIQSKLFLEFFPRFIYCKQRSTINFLYGSENMIFEIYITENPMSTVES